MNNNEITDEQITKALTENGFKDYTADEGRVMLLQLLSKKGAGYYNSYTENNFLSDFKLNRKSGLVNRAGMAFITSMVYKHSNEMPRCVDLMRNYLKG